MHTYHDTYQAFPCNQGGPNEGRTWNATPTMIWGAWSVHIPLMPYIEMGPRYDVIIQELPAPWDNRECLKGPVSAYSCPSDSNVTLIDNAMDAGNARVSYVACYGDAIANVSELGRPRRGLFQGSREFVKMGAISDGTSNTIIFSEAQSPALNNGNAIKGNLAHLSTLNTDFIPGPCLQKVDRNLKVIIDPLTTESNRCISFRGGPVNTGFTTVLPPNSPSCAGGDPPKHNNSTPSATSSHTGGVNAVRGDGSVFFVSDTISTGSGTNEGLNVRDVGSGRSPYGVWGALGSINGTESVSP